eukprot:scaffold1784_cov116-Cylindrotheca_fusiformis.AAC.13
MISCSRITTAQSTRIAKATTSFRTSASSFHSEACQRGSTLHSSRRMRLSPPTTAAVSLLSLSYSTISPFALSNQSSMTATKSLLSSLKLDNSWPRELSPETEENFKKSLLVENLDPDTDNRTKRPVFNGHYVLVEPTGLRNPERVLVSNDVAYNLLKLTPEQVKSDDFLQWVSGNLVLEETWATPYALSIMGTRYTNNCPYGTGNGYGDGRAISIAELNGYELQLKGAGTTPFHRGADGRAVLRSSIREFLASEAMHYLGVKTTRALSLVKSNQDRANRPWYSEDAVLQIPDMDDIRLAQYPEEQRRQIIQQLRITQKADPNVMVSEACAITCRVSPSFVRVGHLDLYARRVEQASMESAKESGKKYDTATREWKELEDMIWHACKRDYRKEAYDPFIKNKDLPGAASALLKLAAENIAVMVSHWVRVGFAQGNFNADNCLVGGITMDYGPFGWMEEYNPLFAKWTGSGEHFGFLNQPSAGFVNYQVLVESVIPVIAANEADPDEILENFMTEAQGVFESKLKETFRTKLGLPLEADAGDELWAALQKLFLKSRTDWTLFWRQLTYVMRDFPDLESAEYEEMMQILEGSSESSPFYEPLTPEVRREWIAWLKDWRDVMKATRPSSGEAVFESMRLTNPKYVLREWMLVDAYSTAAEGDETILNELYELIQRPYDEGSSEEAQAYYRRAPESAVARGGTAFMSCSS